jgi:hypothetical protein
VLDYIEKHYLSSFLESVTTNTTKVKEILIAKADIRPGFTQDWSVEGKDITIKKFGYDRGWNHAGFHYQGIQHALGLHACIDKATQDYIWIIDPDGIIYPKTDKIFLELMDKNNLDIIGLSHYNALETAFTFFPNVINLLVKKDKLPDASFLGGKIKPQSYWRQGARPNDESYPALPYKFDGKYLLPGCINSIADEYPANNQSFETGCNLYYWSKINNWRWLSFQCENSNLYTTQYFKSNFKLSTKLYRKNLFYHVGSSSIRTEEELEKLGQDLRNKFNESQTYGNDD